MRMDFDQEHMKNCFDPLVVRDLSVGSEAYNAPELWEKEAT